MNSKHLILATVLAAVSSALLLSLPAAAQDATPDYPQASASTLGRAEVRADAAQAHAAGLIASSESPETPPAAGVPLSRVQVLAELHEAKRLGLVGGGESLALPTEAQQQAVYNAGLRAVAAARAGRAAAIVTGVDTGAVGQR
jgi:Domain of unknown function (DUF4148)